jgi:hypothetical protein
MVVRAGRRVAAGEEVQINYLGRGALRPLGQRRAELEGGYGFTCACDRWEAGDPAGGSQLGRPAAPAQAGVAGPGAAGPPVRGAG